MKYNQKTMGCKKYLIVKSLYSQLVAVGEIETNYGNLAEKFTCSPRTISGTLKILRDHFGVRSEQLRQGQRCAGIRLFLPQKASNKINIDNYNLNTVKSFLNSEEGQALLSNINVQYKKEDIKKFMFSLWRRGTGTQALKEFERHYTHNPLKLLKVLIYGITRIEWGRGFTKNAMLITIRTVWKRSESWFEEHIIKPLKEWTYKALYHVSRKIEQRKKRVKLFFQGKHDEVTIKTETMELIKNIQEQFNQTIRQKEMVQKNFTVFKKLLQEYVIKGRATPEHFEDYINACKVCRIDDNGKLVYFNKKTNQYNDWEVFQSTNKENVQKGKEYLAKLENKQFESRLLEEFESLGEIPDDIQQNQDMYNIVSEVMQKFLSCEVVQPLKEHFKSIEFVGFSNGCDLWFMTNNKRAVKAWEIYSPNLRMKLKNALGRSCNVNIGRYA